MLEKRTFAELLLIVLSLAFFPEESRILLFQLKPEHWYGELVIRCKDEVYIVAKNSSRKNIEMELPQVVEIFAIQESSPEAFKDQNRQLIPPESVSIIHTNAAFPELSARLVNLGGVRFQPADLHVATPADEFTIILGIFLIVTLCVYFSCLIWKYGNDRSVSLPDKEAPQR